MIFHLRVMCSSATSQCDDAFDEELHYYSLSCHTTRIFDVSYEQPIKY